MKLKIYLAEAIGTAILVLGGCGVAMAFGIVQAYGPLSVALAFGLSLALVAFMFGSISGAHVNPAVTIALALSNKFSWKLVPGYIVAQVVGGILGGSILYIIYSSIPNFPIDQTGFATNIVRPGEDGKPLYQLALIIEVVMTTLLCLAVLATTRKDFPKISIPILLGVVLALVHLISMPITNTSVNPARSIGVAVFIKESWTYLWVFILAPIVGAAIASLIHRAVLDDVKKEELTLQADVPSDEGARKD